MKPFLFFMNFLTTTHKIGRYSQTWQLWLIQIETQAISPSKIRPQSEKIAPILTSFIYVIVIIIIINKILQKNCPIFKSHSIAPSEVGRSGYSYDCDEAFLAVWCEELLFNMLLHTPFFPIPTYSYLNNPLKAPWKIAICSWYRSH